MLYLEDYLEMIEHLPQELRDRFTEMRELDLSVQNNMDDIEKRVKVLFNEWKRNPNDLPPTADLEFEGIKKEYYKTLEDQDEKVVLANQMYELVDRYLRRLDTELHKFKCELEADNKGITELLEKRSLELDTPITSTTSSQKENRYERYTSSRPREKRRSDSCQSAGGVTYPEKRPHLAHSLSLSEQRHSVAATNGNNVLLASQLQQHVVQQGNGGLHAMTQSQQLATSNTTTTSPSPHHHSNSHHSPHHINTYPTIINSNNTTNNALINTGQQSLSASSHTLANLSATHPSISAAAPTTTHHGQSMAMAAVSQSTTSHHHHHHQQHGVGSSSVPVSAGSANGSGVMVGVAAAASSSSSAASGGGGGGGYALVSGGAGPAIAAAASQAIAATQKMQQGRRTPSLKASYEAINSTGSGGLMKVNDLAIGRELAGAAQTAIQAIQHDSNKKKAKKYASSASHHSSSSSSSSSALRHSMAASSTASTVNQQSQHVDMGEVDSYVSGGGIDVGVSVDDMGGVGGGDDLPGANGEYIDSYDPNEPRYCLCNQVSYGDMVACDNEDCPSEWFHYPCVGITAPPKGKWYCPQCTSSMRRRGNRKN